MVLVVEHQRQRMQYDNFNERQHPIFSSSTSDWRASRWAATADATATAAATCVGLSSLDS